MLYSIKGKVSEKERKSIIIETNDFDYEIFVSNIEDYSIGEYVHLFLYQVIKEDDRYLIGFRSKDEKSAFKLLLNVQGIGPKTAISILSNVNFQNLLTAISNNDINFIKTIPGVSSRIASQILLDLNDYIEKENKDNEIFKEVRLILKNLNFKLKDVDEVLSKIYLPNLTRETLLKEALRRLGKNE